MTWFLKLENLAILLVVLAAYYMAGYSWWLFALLFLAPDLSFAGYLLGPKIGAWCYNLVHTWIFPMVLLALSWLPNGEILFLIGLIFMAHIAFDRMLGYGLKHESSFQDTHLGRIGRE